MSFAVIQTGGKQYLVSPGKKLKIEKLEKKEGAEITFRDVLLFEEHATIKVGKPFVKDASVSAKIVRQGKRPKVIVFKYKPKKRSRKKKGHRQPYTEIEILDIEIGRKKIIKEKSGTPRTSRSRKVTGNQ